jgi:hypothetical protein
MSGKEFQRELQSANEECGRLREENKRLRQLLTDYGIPITATRTQGPPLVQGMGSASNIVSHASDSKAKIAIDVFGCAVKCAVTQSGCARFSQCRVLIQRPAKAPSPKTWK